MDQRPRLAARLEEDVVDLEPACLHLRVRRRLRGHRRRRIAGEAEVQLALADAAREPLGKVAQARCHLFQPPRQIVRAGVELGLLRFGSRQAHGIRLHMVGAAAVFVFRAGKQPACAVVEEVALGAGEVAVLGRLALRAAQVVAQSAAHVAQMNQHAELPIGHVVQVHARREEVVGKVAAALVEQRFGEHGHRAGGDEAGRRRRLGKRCPSARDLHRVEAVRLVGPPPADRDHSKNVGADDCAERNPEPALQESPTALRRRDVGAFGDNLCSQFPCALPNGLPELPACHRRCLAIRDLGRWAERRSAPLCRCRRRRLPAAAHVRRRRRGQRPSSACRRAQATALFPR